MKLRLFLERTYPDYCGRMAGKENKSVVVNVPGLHRDPTEYYVIGGEWIGDRVEAETDGEK